MRDVLGDDWNTNPGSFPKGGGTTQTSTENDTFSGFESSSSDDDWLDDDDDYFGAVADDDNNNDDDYDFGIVTGDESLDDDDSDFFGASTSAQADSSGGSGPSIDEAYENWNSYTQEQKDWVRARFAVGLVRLKYIKRFWTDEVVIEPINVKVAPAYRKNNKTGALEKLSRKRRGNAHQNLMDRRFCPFCWEEKQETQHPLLIGRSQFHIDAGVIPTFVVLMVGTSDAGKTVYLTMMYRDMLTSPSLNSNIKFAISPNTTNSTDEIGNVSMAHHLSVLEKDGILPRHTRSGSNIVPPPLPFTVEVTHSSEKGGNSKNAQSILYMRDIAGEILTSIHGDALDVLAPQFGEFDGFLMLIDPKTFWDAEGLFRREYENRSESTADGALYFTQLNEFLMTYMSKQRGEGKISAPTVVAITKGDLFRDPDHREALKEKGVRQNNRAILKVDSKRRSMLSRRFYEDISDGTEKILQALTSDRGYQILDFIERRFTERKNGEKNVYYSLVAALEGIEMEEAMMSDGHVENRVVGGGRAFKNNVAPDKVRESIEILLMMLNIIPPFHKIAMRETNEDVEQSFMEKLFGGKQRRQAESETQRRRENNVRIMNEWREQYVVGWDEIKLREE